MSGTSSIPRHLGIILDGNRRWAKDNGLPQLEGHRRGYENVKTITEAAIARGVEIVTVFVFSTENWKRTEEEVKYLLDLLHWVASNEVDYLHSKNLRARFLGARDRIAPKTIKAIEAAEAKTAGNTGGTLAFCLNYGGQQEIVDAVKALIEQGRDDITVESISEHLYAPDLPLVDFIIRTSGEHRLSNFMLWRAAYAELYFTEVHWPAFTESDLDLALADYAERERRFGK